MRKRTTICVLLLSCTALFSQGTEMVSLTVNNFTAVTPLLSFDVPSEIPSGPASSVLSLTIDNGITDSPSPVQIAGNEAFAMQSAISNFFNAFGTGKTDCLKESCTQNVSFKTHLQDQTGNHHIFEENINDLIPFVAKSGNSFTLYVQYELLTPDPSTNQFRAPYTFYINDEVSHCGVCTFELEKVGIEWKIKQMVDTRSRSCQ